MDIEHVPEVVETKTIVIEEEKFILTLSRDEAEIISFLTGQVSGDPNINKARRICGDIYSSFSKMRVIGWQKYHIKDETSLEIIPRREDLT